MGLEPMTIAHALPAELKRPCTSWENNGPPHTQHGAGFKVWVSPSGRTPITAPSSVFHVVAYHVYRKPLTLSYAFVLGDCNVSAACIFWMFLNYSMHSTSFLCRSCSHSNLINLSWRHQKITPLHLPSMELTYPTPTHFWRWIFLSQSGIC